MKYAFYAFINFRMIGIHAGIQGGHCAGELQATRTKSYFCEEQRRVAQEWLDDHNVFVFLHGGQSVDLVQAYEKYCGMLSLYPSALFREEPGAFGDTNEGKGAATAWGIVLPESVYAARWKQPDPAQPGYYSAEIEENGTIIPYGWTEGTPQYDFLKYKSPMRLAY
jgi:hypothetical protein